MNAHKDEPTDFYCMNAQVLQRVLAYCLVVQLMTPLVLHMFNKKAL